MRFPWQKKERVPKRRKKRTNPSPLAVARAFADAAKVLAPGHGFNSERSQRAENGGRP